MNFRTFDLNLLRVLDALLLERSTVRAGQRLGLSQPAVSSALKRLRQSLGDPLFVREGQALVPTPYAQALENELRERLAGMETLLSAKEVFDPATAEETFRLSGAGFFAEMLMPKLGARLQREAPGVRVQLVDLVPDDYVRTLQQYKVDLALLPDTEAPPWARKRVVFHSNYLVIARQDHPAIVGAGVQPGEVLPLDLFCALGHVLFSPEGKLKGPSDAALAKIGRERHVQMSLPVFAGVWRAVAESDLIALIPNALARHVAPRVGLSIYEMPMPVPVLPLVMMWHERFDSHPAHRWMRDLLAELLAPLNEGFDPLP